MENAQYAAVHPRQARVSLSITPTSTDDPDQSVAFSASTVIDASSAPELMKQFFEWLSTSQTPQRYVLGFASPPLEDH